MATYTDPRSGEPLPDEFTREPVKPPPGDMLDPIAASPVSRAGPSSVSVIIGALVLVAIVFFFMSYGSNSPTTPPPAQQTSENVTPTPAPEPVPPAQPTQPGQTTSQ
jgi:hypothetical protein